MDVAATARFFDGRQAKGHAVNLRVVGNLVQIRGDDESLSADWDLDTVVGTTTPDGVVTFRRGVDPARLLVSDPALLQALRPGWRGRRQSGWAVAGAAATALVGFAVLLVGAAPVMLEPLVPASWEASLGSRAQATLLSEHRQCGGLEGQGALDRLVHRLRAAAGIERPVTLVVADDQVINAFTLPGNRVLILQGLIAFSADGDELAGVIAHELGHVAHRDPVRQMLRQVGLNAVAAAFGWGSFSSGGVATVLLGLSYGRAAEADADQFAVTTLRSAGLRADGLGRFFAHIQTKGHTDLGFLSDHPAPAERRSRAEQPPDGAPAFDAAEWRAIRAICQS